MFTFFFKLDFQHLYFSVHVFQRYLQGIYSDFNYLTMKHRNILYVVRI